MNTRLIAYRNSPVDVGATTTTTVSSAPTTTSVTLNITLSSGAQVGTQFSVGDSIASTSHIVIGEIQSVTSTSITIKKALYTITSGDTVLILREKTYELDLQKAPSIALNYQFADIANPEQRKASYSQTFKLPFTDRNNEFFENFFNVNLDSLVFNSSKKFEAVLYQGTVPQFEGVIQLKSVLLKSQLYEVVLLSNGTNLFTLLGSKKLVEAWTDEQKIKFRHLFNKANVENSWDGTSNAFQNLSGESFRDTSADVNVIMYPFQVTKPRFWYEDEDGRYLRMSSSDATNLSNEGLNPQDYMVSITQFRPAIQLRLVLKQILNSVGYTYTSSFLDSSYFGRLFMTTCNHTGVASPVMLPTAGAVDGSSSAANSTPIADLPIFAGAIINCASMQITNASNQAGTNLLSNYVKVVCDTTQPASSAYNLPVDDFGLWSTAKNGMLRSDLNMTTVNVNFQLRLENLKACYNNGCALQVRVTQSPANSSVETEVAYYENFQTVPVLNNNNNATFNIYLDIPITTVDVGHHAHFYVRILHLEQNNSSNPSRLIYGYDQVGNVTPTSQTGMGTKVQMSWAGFGDAIYGLTVDPINGIDPAITQKAFLKDLIQRFNLLVIPDNDNPTNLRIEPYNDFISGGETKNWTDKLDTSKEIIVKDTTSLQKAQVIFTDSEDVDLMNKSIAEFSPTVNVYGKIDTLNTANEFAKGKQEYKSIFAPYINQMVYASNDESEGTFMPRVAVQYEFSYNRTGYNSYEDTFEATKSKLFYYYGQPTSLPSTPYHLHSIDIASGALVTHDFNSYPLCSPFELNIVTGNNTMTPNNRSLYWNTAMPLAPNLEVFNTDDSYSILGQSLYYAYWRQFYNLIYNKNSKLVECYFNIDEVDIFQFKFNDEIFVKDSYYRILNITNYQVGSVASTKVTMIKIDEFYTETCNGCDYVLNEINGSNIWQNVYVWCPAQLANCSGDSMSQANQRIGAATTIECCDCQGGTFIPIDPNLTLANGTQPFSTWPDNHGVCVANTNSLPIQKADLYRTRNLRDLSAKTYVREVMGGLYKPVKTGNDTTKYSPNMLTTSGNDLVIKYKAERTDSSKLRGESHRIVLIGNTTGNTRGYAHIDGNPKAKPLMIEPNQVVNIRVKGISTVIGGTSATQTLGKTEAFAYVAGFAYRERETIQVLGIAGGENEYNIKEAGGGATCSLYIDTTENIIRFGLQDSQTDTKRIWQLTADIDIVSVVNMSRAIDAQYALFQNGVQIQLENTDYLLWN